MIGRDKFATIYKCKKISNRKRYLAKFYQISNTDLHGLECFLNEAEILRDSDHANISRVIDVYNDGISAVIIVERCTGGELLQRLRGLELTENKIANYFKQVVSAVIYLHSNKIVHGDLRPEIISFWNKDENSCIKITEFGSCKHFSRHLKKIEKISSYYYTSPEVIKGSYNEKCDVWSMGVILYLLLSGTLPYKGSSIEELNSEIFEKDLIFGGKKWKKISDEAKDLIQKMLNRSVSHRISAKEVYQHNWVRLRAENAVADNKIMSKTLENLSKFETQSKLQRATLAFMVTHVMSSDEIGILTNVFRDIDVNGDGSLSQDEIKEAMAKHTGFSNKNIEELIAKIDLDQNGLVNYSEFLAAALNWEKEINRERLEETFNAFDLDHNGKISVDELEKAFGGSQQGKEMFVDMINEADIDGDGEIDIEEFCAFMNQLTHRSKYNKFSENSI